MCVTRHFGTLSVTGVLLQLCSVLFCPYELISELPSYLKIQQLATVRGEVVACFRIGRVVCTQLFLAFLGEISRYALFKLSRSNLAAVCNDCCQTAASCLLTCHASEVVHDILQMC